jgi:hypothetical protein
MDRNGDPRRSDRPRDDRTRRGGPGGPGGNPNAGRPQHAAGRGGVEALPGERLARAARRD